jgi:phage gp16-like protein
MTAAPAMAAGGRRNPMLAKVHLAAKELGLDEDARRDVLERVTGRRSAKDCTDLQLDAVLTEFRRLGWKPQPRKGPAPARMGTAPILPRAADSPMARKARALWLSLYALGAVRTPSETALEAFAARQLKCERMQWADQGQSYKLIEALKAMALRAGWDASGDDLVEVKRRLVAAQWMRIAALTNMKQAGPPTYFGLAGWAQGRRITSCHKGLELFGEAEIDAAIAHLGPWIRKAQASRGEEPAA